MTENKTKLNIAATAKHLFSTLGYEKTSMKLLAKEAEVNEVTIYRNFGTKENLLQFITNSYVEEVCILDKIKEIQDQKVEDVLRTLGNDYLNHCFSNMSIYKIQLKLNDDYGDFEKLELTKNFIAAGTYYFDYLKSKNIFSGDSNLYAKAFFTGILGFFTSYILDDNYFEEEEMIKGVNVQIDMIVNSVK